GGNRVERVPKLVPVHVDGNVGTAEQLQPTGMVQVQVREHDPPDVAQAVPRRADRRVQPVLVPEVGYGERLLDRGRPELREVRGGAGVEQDRARGGVVDERGDDGDPSSRRGWVEVAGRADARPGENPPLVVFDVAQVQKVH